MKHQGAIPWESKIGWLAGVIDGEGTIGIYLYNDKGKYHYPRYGIWIVNSDKRLIDNASQLFREIGAEKIFVALKNYRNNKLGKKQCWYVQVNRRADIYKILKIIEPLLISKREQAQVILNFMDENQDIARKTIPQENYLKVINELKRIKQSIGEPVETKR